MKTELDDIRYRLRVSKLEAQVALLGIERDGLNREIANPRTLTVRRIAAIERRDRASIEWEQRADELNSARLSRA
jgi:multidrug resistance efflux pump